MKTVLLLGGPADGRRVEVHGTMRSISIHCRVYQVVPLCSHGEVHWFGVLDGADPLALLIGGYNPVASMISGKLVEGIDADADRKCATGDGLGFPAARDDIVWAPKPAATGVGIRPASPYGTGGVKEGDDR